MATKTPTNPRVLYQNRLWENLTPPGGNYTRIILSATDGKIPHQVMIDPKDLEKQPKKAPGEHYVLNYNGKEVFSNLSYPLVKQKETEWKKLSQYQKFEFKIV